MELVDSSTWENRPDSSTDLGLSDSGRIWQQISGTWGVSSQAPYTSSSFTGGGGGQGAQAVLETKVCDGVLTAKNKHGAVSTNVGYGLIFRMSDINNFWCFQFFHGTSTIAVYLLKIAAGVVTDTHTTVADSGSYPELFSVSFQGSFISASVQQVAGGSTATLTATDAFNQNATMHGLNIYSATSPQLMDDWKLMGFDAPSAARRGLRSARRRR